MPRSTLLKPTHKAIKAYHQTLQTYRDEHVEHEGAVETAFQQLLAETGRAHGWTLLPKLKLQVKGKNIYPDGTLRDFFNLRRGFFLHPVPANAHAENQRRRRRRNAGAAHGHRMALKPARRPQTPV